MNYFIVFQNKTYKEEKEGQYLWAPQKTNQGRSIFHWENMKKIQPGDIIFSMFRQLNTANEMSHLCHISEPRRTDFRAT